MRQGYNVPTLVSGLVPLGALAGDRQAGPLERCDPSDRFFDYVLGEYEPLAPAADKLRAVSLLFESFALSGIERQGRHLVETVRAALGPHRTVWGVKWHRTQATLGWELYFYDFERRHADLSIARLVDALAPCVRVDAREPFALPWHMFSVEVGLPELTGQRPAAVDVYIDMRSYKLHGDRMELENVYTFHDPRTEIDHVLHRLRSSVHFSWRRDPLATLLPPWLFRCGRLCVANKRGADALYASRIPTNALARFLAWQSWPAALGDFVQRHGHELDHLQWCVGVDFEGSNSGPVIRKAGFYGSV